MTDDFWPPENYYRVSLKPLIFDDQGRLVVGRDGNGKYCMIGGGWDHGETYADCLKREAAEEIAADIVSVGNVVCFCRCETAHGRPKVSIAVQVMVANFNFHCDPNSEEVVAADFVTKEQFKELPFVSEEKPWREYADQIWAVVEKNDKNR